MSCIHCGGSGVLNIESIGEPDAAWRLIWSPVKYASWCHACPNGLVWKELLNT
jgi:hypothetical protein